MCQYNKKNYCQAIRKYRSALTYNPNRFRAYNGWGSSLSNLGKFDDAIQKFKQALKIEPGYTLAHLNIVLALLLRKNDEEALKYFHNIDGEFNRTLKRFEMRQIYKHEIELLDTRLLKTTDSGEVLLVKERKECVERLLDLLRKEEKEEDFI